jgi:hypothetical protein
MKQVLRLDDEQLHALLRGPKRVPVWARDKYLREVARELAGKSVGGGNLQKAIAAAQREWLEFDYDRSAINVVAAGT